MYKYKSNLSLEISELQQNIIDYVFTIISVIVMKYLLLSFIPSFFLEM